MSQMLKSNVKHELENIKVLTEYKISQKMIELKKYFATNNKLSTKLTRKKSKKSEK